MMGMPGSAQRRVRYSRWTVMRIVAVVAALGMSQGGGRAAEQPAEDALFESRVRPLVAAFCLDCHNEQVHKSGIRLDKLSASPDDRQLHLWKDILGQLTTQAMPPEDAPQPTEEERRRLVEWTEQTLLSARKRPSEKNGAVRKLTVAQYRNTLRDLLGLREDFTDILPHDAVSKDGFTNNAQLAVLSPLQLEAFFEIAEQALDAVLVDVHEKPVIQQFRVDLGEGIRRDPPQEPLILGAFSTLLPSSDFLVTELAAPRPFDYRPHAMQRSFRFIEGYAGNDTVRAWRDFHGLDHSVFACMRGAAGYPKGEAHTMTSQGLLLRPAIPNSEIFGQANTYGPMANFKIALRELPARGNFRITVRAARYSDALLLGPEAAPAMGDESRTSEGVLRLDHLDTTPQTTISVARPGIYQVDAECSPGEAAQHLAFSLGDRQFSGQLSLPSGGRAAGAQDEPPSIQRAPFAVLRLPAGSHRVEGDGAEGSRLRSLVFTPIEETSEQGRKFLALESRTVWLGVHLGLRRDCGSTLSPVGPPQPVKSGELCDFVFEGALGEFPSPDVEPDNVNYLAGIREIAVRSEYTDGRDMPRLLVRSVEFEGPYYESWPPESHRRIFFPSPSENDPEAYAREVIVGFARRAFRRPLRADESERLLQQWERAFADSGDWEQSVRDVLLVVLTSPQFLFLTEESQGPQAEPLDGYELASKLSYFLWNAAPDDRLLELAEGNALNAAVDCQIERMLDDPRCRQFIQEFARQWLSLDRFDVVDIDPNRYPRLTREARRELRQEPEELLHYLLTNNLPVDRLVQADFLMANDIVAAYYGLEASENGFVFSPVPLRSGTQGSGPLGSASLGGVLSQAAVLSGLSDGRQGNPVKRGAWLARKIIAEPPDDPPPNVPKLPEDEPAKPKTLREKLEQHRRQEGCAKCHAGIDPWGLPFEKYDAAGLFQAASSADAHSTLPDGTEVSGLEELKAYLAGPKRDAVAFSFLKHLATYAIGRELTYSELEWLREQAVRLRADNYRLRDMVRLVVHSPMFLEK